MTAAAARARAAARAAQLMGAAGGHMWAGEVSRADMGEDWPLTVDHGHVVRIGPDNQRAALVFIDPDGEVYMLNGIARAHIPDASSIDAIWAEPEARRGLEEKSRPADPKRAQTLLGLHAHPFGADPPRGPGVRRRRCSARTPATRWRRRGPRASSRARRRAPACE